MVTTAPQLNESRAMCTNMAAELDNWVPVTRHAPASAEVYQRVRRRMQNLRGLRQFGQEHDNPQSVLKIGPEEIRQLGSRFLLLDDKQIEEEAISARKWLFGVLDCHDKMLDREHQMRLFRLVEEKQRRKAPLTEMETLYMALTDYNLATPGERLRSAFRVVLHLKFAERLRDISTLATVRTKRLQRATTLDAEMDEIRDRLVERMRLVKVDHFACAIPLTLLTATANNPSIVDDNAGCCGICKISYTALSAEPEPDDETTSSESLEASPAALRIKELLADFPIRIKYCGHIVGKACLERWMATPKIDEAKYPHRTCPLCRVKIEGITAPEVPLALVKHLREDWRAMETVKELAYGYDIELRECLDMVVACMSDEIACKELLAEIRRTAVGLAYARVEKVLHGKMSELEKEKWAWGFRGRGIWGTLRDEWMDSGVIRRV